MKDISILDNIFEIEENIKSNLNYIIKGRRLDELSDEELILLKELYLLINKQLENRIEFKYEVPFLKEGIIISIVSFVGWGLYCVVTRRKK